MSEMPTRVIPPGFSYADACATAAEQQGLNPLMAALRERAIPFEPEQTGGYTMAVSVVCRDGTFAGTFWGSDDDSGPWVLSWYEGDGWRTGDGIEPDHINLTLDRALDLIEERR